MGNSSSRSVRAILDLTASTIVNVNQSCLANAQNQILIKVGGATNVTLQNLNITQVADADVSCIFEADLDLQSTITGVADKLDNIVQQANASGSVDFDVLTGSTFFDHSSTNISVTNRIANSLTRNMVTTCLASAINSYKIQIGKVGGNFTIKDMNINQVAKAHIIECLSTVKVDTGNGTNDPTLPDYVAQKLDNNIISLKPGWQQHMGPDFWANEQQANGQNFEKYGTYAAAGAAGVATIVAAVAAVFIPSNK